jgi:hypothetical protein
VQAKGIKPMFVTPETAFLATEPETGVEEKEKPRFNGVCNDFWFSGVGFTWIMDN